MARLLVCRSTWPVPHPQCVFPMCTAWTCPRARSSWRVTWKKTRSARWVPMRAVVMTLGCADLQRVGAAASGRGLQPAVPTERTRRGFLQVLGADGLLYQSLEDVLSVGQELNPAVRHFEASCFTGMPATLTSSQVRLAWLQSAMVSNAA